MSRLPLEGFTVVAIEQAVAGPIASRHLADLGARVIKVERPEGGDFARDYDHVVKGMASHFVWANRNKESLALDIKSEEGREVLESLLSRADVFLQNLGPGAAERAGLSAAQLVARYPRLVACDMSGFGVGGPYAEKRAYDLIVQAETGSIAITGTPGAPAKPGVAVADIGAGMYAYSTILAALLDRERTGKGRAIQISMFDANIEWMNYSLYFVGYGGGDHVPHGVGTQAISPYGAYPTRDGKKVVVGVQNEREWRRLGEQVLDRPDLVVDPSLNSNGKRVAQRERVDRECAAAFAEMSLEQALELLDAAGIANGLLRSVPEVLEHPQLEARGRWREIDSPVGPLRALLPPPIVDGWEPRMDPVPALGEQTAPILAELGYAPDVVAGMQARGVAG
jgi:itaconate CoA-transferase